jgi:hypothetical protein
MCWAEALHRALFEFGRLLCALIVVTIGYGALNLAAWSCSNSTAIFVFRRARRFYGKAGNEDGVDPAKKQSELFFLRKKQSELAKRKAVAPSPRRFRSLRRLRFSPTPPKATRKPVSLARQLLQGMA